MMKTFNFYFLLIIFAWIIAGCDGSGSSPDPKPPGPPNIILILADDLGYETIGANGGTSYKTPNLDALAESGMRFDQAYATPLCTTTRVQLLTGKYNFRNYIGFGLLDPGQKTIAHLLQSAGYRTGVVGKWQLFGTPTQQALAGRVGSLPQEAGFDDYCLWQIEEGGSRYKDPVVQMLGEPARVVPGAYGPDVFADCAKDFITNNAQKPFFLFYSLVHPHTPFQPTPDHPDYAASTPDDPSNNQYFASNMAYMDKLVGSLVDHLNTLNLRENTLLIFTGDNGTNKGVVSILDNQPVQGDKGHSTKAGTHVPLIVNWPVMIQPGQVNENLVDFTDFLPTFMDAVDQRMPSNFVTDGLSFYPQLVGEAKTVRSWIFCHYEPRWNGLSNARYAQTKRYKLYRGGRFYDTVNDPEEKNPLSDSDIKPKVLSIKKDLQKVIDHMYNQ